MRHENSVLHALTKQIPWGEFERLVAAHGADRGVRRLATRSQLIALLYGQFSAAGSLREIEAGLASHRARLYHLGARGASRSTLADANARRPEAVFSGLASYMMGQVGRGLRRASGPVLRLIDSTGLRLAGLGAEWAHFSATATGAKLHVVYDPDADAPLYASVSTARTNDIVAAKQMPIEPGATYVFDLGYYDYGWWRLLDEAGCRIVTRFKRNTPLETLEERYVPPEAAMPDAGAAAAILSDRIGRLPARLARNRRNPMSRPVREVCIRIETGRTLRLLTNDLDSPARAIADLYRRRWAVELFFRWIKQTLNIRHFLGRSENAVRIQIAVALIAFLALRLAQAAGAAACLGPTAFARLVRANLMHRRPIDRLLDPPRPSAHDPRQISLPLAPA